MKSYVFRNKGEMDIRSITTFGVSSKENKSPIGFFGTGLKYAIAVLLRNKCEIVIHTGGKKYEFTTVHEKIRVDVFQTIYMNGERLAFTTELGKNWEMWMAFRELACNALDELGSWDIYEDSAIPITDTAVIVRGRAFDLAWAERDQIILNAAEIFSSPDVSICEGKSDWIYYRGVRCKKLQSPSLYTYDVLKECKLTEDRTFSDEFSVRWAIDRGICASNHRDMIRSCITAEKAYETSFSFGWNWSKEFESVAIEEYKKYTPSLNQDVRAKLRAQYKDSLIEDERSQLDELDSIRLDTAIQFCKDLKMPVDIYTIKVSSQLGDTILGMAEKETIWLSTRVFSMGTKMVAGTLLEEYIHLKFHVRDETRQMQNHLIDMICSLGERVLKRSL